MRPYPIFLNDLDGRRCVIVGGDHEAERKAASLLEVGAAVEVIAPEVTAALQAWAAEERLMWHAREWQRGDLAGAFLAIVSETNPPRTAPIYAEAVRERVLFNAMDDVPHCTFVAGSAIRRGPLVVSISTSGAAPAYAVRLRQRLERELGPAVGRFLTWMQAIRPAMAATYPDGEERKRRWYAIVDGDVLPLLEAGRDAEALQALADLAGEAVARCVDALERSTLERPRSAAQ